MDLETMPLVKGPNYPQNSLNYQVITRKWAFIIAFFCIGIFNNNGYVMVQAGSSTLAKQFDEQDFMGVFQFAMTGISILTRYVNGSCLANLPYITKATIVTIL